MTTNYRYRIDAFNRFETVAYTSHPLLIWKPVHKIYQRLSGKSCTIFLHLLSWFSIHHNLKFTQHIAREGHCGHSILDINHSSSEKNISR